MKRIFLLLTICVIVLVGCGSNVSSWQKQYDLGIRYLNEGNYADAIIAFTAAINIDEKNPASYLGRAQAYLNLVMKKISHMQYLISKRLLRLMKQLPRLIADWRIFIFQQMITKKR